MLWILSVIAGLGLLGFLLGRGRAVASAGGDVRLLHSLPTYYGLNVTLLTMVPAVLVLGIWLIIQPIVINNAVTASLPADYLAQTDNPALVMTEVRRLASGFDVAVERGLFTNPEVATLDVTDDTIRDQLAGIGVALGADVSTEVLAAAQQFRVLAVTGRTWMLVVVFALAVAGLGYAFLRTNKDQRARNSVERAILGILIAASTLAILTTVGIVLSMLWDTRNFFQLYPWQDFFFGLEWRPSFEGGSELGLIPLLWGTMYISFIALLVAAPIGLFAAIYMAEYASGRVRSVAKPLIEVLAGIPTIVYGLFALITVGPMLRDYFAQPLGLGDSSSSVMTAGIVMGIMLIPFVSSLSDDIINAVPQSLRDGSYGLGATRSETIKQVILPAALPGIVGAVLLAASRAIGETMIVVLGAGAAARLDLNPFEAMTTVTVKIVGQLTGDTDFSSPEALVAFALGLTLFVITLCLNIVALVVVRKYREQYD
ncbi:phosphate ABC transporter permease subunit PstC [Rhodobacteraceae bacterium N5(2021)]|uniref:Phosphate transport system permease protein n=1 Tax=Gymnodinialimonas phycosphaerae TaxID=2841589 RepID=A0A975YH16_9RHOB|nr:phosphate ABC transporter permease subunit PstC [Gymnodinialimonas phycosphaerae]MBY4892169.1 phosphate ABC transporter permease subunit PstC [Gymnodinialimonas phycosphaerae]